MSSSSASAGGGTATLTRPDTALRSTKSGPIERPALGGPAFDEPVPAPGGGGGVLVGLVALCFAAGTFAIHSDRLQSLESQRAADVQAWRDQLGRIEGQIAALGERLPLELEALEQRALAQGRQQSAGLTEQVAGFQSLADQTQVRIEGLASEISGLRALMAEQDRGARLAQVRLGERVDGVYEALAALEARTIAVEEGQRIVAVGGPSAGSSATSRGAAEAPARPPSWQGLLTDLKHASAGIRLEALYALGATRDEATVPYILPMLQDEDIFVRMTAIGILAEDFQAREAVPPIIDTLEHENSAVRETAMLALRDLTGREFRFDPSGSNADRAKAVKRWRDWWARNGQAFLEG